MRPPTNERWHALSVEETVRRLGGDAVHGLSRTEAARRLAEHGPNELAGRGRREAWQILREQLTSLLTLILIVAALVSAVVGDLTDVIAIALVVVFNTALGFVQDYRAERAMAALKRLAVPAVRVCRDGREQSASARDLVPGDLCRLAAGDLVPADLRLIDARNLRVDQSALTGEAEAVEKQAGFLPTHNLPLSDRDNLAYAGTVVVRGRGSGIVVATGMATELGRVAGLLQRIGRAPTTLQRRLDQLGRGLSVAVVGLVGLILLLGLLRGESVDEMVMTSLSLGVAAVPEGLLAVVTVLLALATQRLLRLGAQIRRLSAIETLGSLTVICTDKTGTLTANRMTVTTLAVAGRLIEIAAAETSDTEDVGKGHLLAPEDRRAVDLLLTVGALCNDARLPSIEAVAEPVAGDPTEVALLRAAARWGLVPPKLERLLPRVDEVPFDSSRRRMTTIHRIASGELGEPLLAMLDLTDGPRRPRFVAFTKGAVDHLLPLCNAVWCGGRVFPLSPACRESIRATEDRLAESGARVLGAALRTFEARESRPSEIERDLVFLGLIGLADPPRPDVPAAIATCRAAGIRPVMITGDHPLTARRTARELSFALDDGLLTGQDLDRLGVDAARDAAGAVSVYARTSPEHKLRIVAALQARGEVVAMTGDGVNDAPALKKADVGVAMGRTGTDVARESADLVLLDDSFATIVRAVEEGRIVHDNVRKFVKYQLTTNSAELWVMLLAPLVAMPLPLLPLQILWMNLVTDGPPALALGLEPAEPDVMRRPPRPIGESVFARGLGRHVVAVGLLIGLVSIAVGYWYWRANLGQWQTMIFTTLVFSQMTHVLAIRSETGTLFRAGVRASRPLLLTVAAMSLLQMAILLVAPARQILRLQPLAPGDGIVALAASALVLAAVEGEKWLLRRRHFLRGVRKDARNRR